MKRPISTSNREWCMKKFPVKKSMRIKNNHLILRNYSIFTTLGCLIIFLACIANASAESIPTPNPTPYMMGVFPHLPPSELEKVFSPMAADIGKHLHREIQFRSGSSYKKFTELLHRQIFDVVFVQPFDYIKIADMYGYLPLATRSEPLTAVIVVPEDSKINKVEDLRGKRIALPPEVAAVSHLAKGYLRVKKILYETKYPYR